VNKYQQNIIWLGLILIVLNLVVNIGEFKSVLFGTPAGDGSTSGGNNLTPTTIQPTQLMSVTHPAQTPAQPQPTPAGTKVT